MKPAAWLALVVLAVAWLARASAADTVVYYHTDALRSVSVVTDAQGNVLERTRYAPYGQVLNRPLRDGPGYTGHQEDAATGLVYAQQRYYDPETGRFLSVDPVQADANTGANFNRYWYAKDNPYRFTDPFGLYACGSKVSSGDCGKIDSFVNKINDSLKGLKQGSSDYKALSAVSQFLGTKNDHNGVTIETASLKEGTVGQATSLKTMQLDMKQIGGVLTNRIEGRNPGLGADEAGVIAGATTAAHETQHLIDANQGIFDNRAMGLVPQGLPTTKVYETATERRAYGIEGSFGRGLGVDVGYSTPAQIEQGVQSSVSAWCTNNSACQ